MACFDWCYLSVDLEGEDIQDKVDTAPQREEYVSPHDSVFRLECHMNVHFHMN